MCPKEAIVFLAEDDKLRAEDYKKALSRAGHKVVIEVDTIGDGLAAIQTAKELGVNVALIDGRLPDGKLDGMIVTRVLKDSIPDVRVVDISYSGEVENADARMTKPNFNPDELGELVNNL